MIFIIKDFRTISTTFQPICPPAFFRCLSNSGTYTELRTTSFIESTGVACSESVCYNRVQLLLYSCIFTRLQSGLFDKHLKKAGGHISRNAMEITIAVRIITEWFGFFGFSFYGIATIVGYLMPNRFYTYTNYMISKHILKITFLNKSQLFFFCTQMVSLNFKQFSWA